MGRGLLDPGSPGHALASEASARLGLDLVALACEAEEEAIKATDVAQPLLLLHSVALLKLLPPDLQQAGVAGHSLGEYTALVASGSLDPLPALALVRERGLAMAAAAAASPGQGMSAVLAADEGPVAAALAEILGPGEVAVVANLNAPGQVVISGHVVALERAAEPLKAAGARRVMPLAVGGAFHSPLMRDAAARLARAIDLAPLRAGSPQAFNVDGAVRTEPDEVRSALKAQLTSAVRWVDCVETLLRLGVQRFVEVGPGGTLTAMGKRIAPHVEWLAVATPEAAAALTA
jgi:[acyl-carrier-protein] S-malonyltransferase